MGHHEFSLRDAYKKKPTNIPSKSCTVRQWVRKSIFLVFFNYTLMFLAVLIIIDSNQKNISSII